MQTSGFTLIECLLALSILALMLTGAVHSYRSFSDRHIAAGAISQWIETIQFARTYALISGQGTTICAGTANQCNHRDYTDGWFIFAERADGTTAQHDANETILATAAPLDARLIFSTNITHPIHFRADGRTNANGRFTVCLASDRTPVAGLFLIRSGRLRPAAEQEMNQCH